MLSMVPQPSVSIVILFSSIALTVTQVFGSPGYGEPLQLERGGVVAVQSVNELKQALNDANSEGEPATILLKDGEYVLDIPTLHITCAGLVVRSESGDREAVVVRGPDEGPDAALRNVFLVSAPDVVIADITLGWCRWHGIQVQGENPHDVSGLKVHNCRIVNCNEQFIKGSSGPDPVGATDGVIEDCLFEFTSGWAYQFYTGGIDIHKGVNWTVSNNLFRNIRVRATESNIAEHAIHFWKRAGQPQNIVVEGNWIIDCDRGIGFGLGVPENGHNGGKSVIRNNMIYNNGEGDSTDVGIGLESAHDVKVENNTVYIATYWAPMEYRFASSSNLVFRNNLVNRPVRNRDGAPEATTSSNIENAEEAWFRNLSGGDLHLNSTATEAIDQGVTLQEFSTDIDGEPRPEGDGWDVGADEYQDPEADADQGDLPDGWEEANVPDPMNPDGDGDSNRI